MHTNCYFTFLFSLLLFKRSFAQQWDGSQTATGIINRGGKVVLNSTNWDDHLELFRYGYGATFKPDHSVNYKGLRLELKGSGANFYVLGGNMGIGTSYPAASLDVHEGKPLGTQVGNFQLLSRVSGSGTNNYIMKNLWLFRDANGDNWWTSRLHDAISIDVSYITPGVDTRTWWERDPMENIQSWGHGNSTFLTINQGNVGVGTVNPYGRLHVYEPNNTHTYAILERSNNAYQAFHVLRPAGAITNANPQWLVGMKQNSTDFEIQTYDGNASIERFCINSNGNVGIGTTDPKEYKLAVNGPAVFTKVVVRANSGNWPDYVFAPTYQLPSLQEVEAFIKEHKHLPEVPSAKEVEEKGLDLGDNQAILLKKIEELTLYVIEQDKRLQKLETANAALQKENQQLKTPSTVK